ncbi:hypothetical protein GCM10022297_12720 [Lactobacillus hamsteri]|uniref:Uncharacterized protein n=1 Tax=Lactobacillus hamsteri DSM 5661 = JCM 6256 TaxID=1423754 RepID=A0A0R1YDS0_9LACO|nr:hypothetical protein [Lactobacillus hamsteri]KRM40608.1 hypothetical protein FC39_GL000424 [Lactobacillus hamsteri DSM 5661 = JCM 6256]
MNFDQTNKIDKEIEKLDDRELQARINESKNQAERNFWKALQDRALQARQRKVINGDFIR